jgi:hypothetical protein
MDVRIKDREILEALKAAGGVQAQAAVLLGCTRVTIWKRIKKTPELAAYTNPRGHATKSTRRKLSEKKRGENHWNWRGGISFGRYCEKFNYEFKERVRDFFGRRCAECGAPETEHTLHVHHVNYRKDACCADDAVPLFVPLCHACHMKTNYNREFWEARYTALINDVYGGQCYLPKADPVRISHPRTNVVPTTARLPLPGSQHPIYTVTTLTEWGIA